MAAAALAAILAEWGSTDSYATRTANLMSTLNPSTVHDNGMADNLYGGPGMDWYFAGMADILFNHTSGEIVTSIRKLMGREDLEPLIQNVATAEIAQQFLDATKAKKLLGWQPRFTLEEGLKKTIDWYLAFLASRDS